MRLRNLDLVKITSFFKLAAAIFFGIYFSLSIASSPTLAAGASYIYDDLGRLVRVVDDQGNVATYHYDEVGNLLSITTDTREQLLPQISSINPDFVRAGATVAVTLSGSNLTGCSLSTDNAGIEITETQITDTSITATFAVMQGARQGTSVVTVSNPIGSASGAIAVYPSSPSPTISPSIKLIQPNGGTGTMTVGLSNSDIFPTAITLSIAKTNIATIDTSQVILPAGETLSTITITGNIPGVTTITASTGTGTAYGIINVAGPLIGANYVYSPTVGVDLKEPPAPPDLVAIEPVLSPAVGVTVESLPPPPSSVTYGSLQAAPVGVSFGPAVTSISPKTGVVGTGNLSVTIHGTNLEGTSSVSFQPGTGISINGPPAVSLDGSSVIVNISIAPDALLGARAVAVTTAGGLARPASVGANLFTVTLPPPEIRSVIPIQAATGTTLTLTVNGKNLSGATSVNFIPDTGIAAGNPPAVNADGTLATVNVSIASDAPTGPRTVTITTGGGTTTDAASAANTFTITATPGTTYSSLLSPGIGVILETSSGPTQRTYGPVRAVPVGVAFGPAITAINPKTGAVGSSNLSVTIHGANLEGTTSVSFQPGTGISVNGPPDVAADGSSVSVDISIAPDAPLTVRTVVINTSQGLARPSVPGANIFTVTLPLPEIISIMPISGADGTTLTLTINGKDLSGATSVDFVPDTGIAVGNPPSVNTDGTLATVNVSIAFDAPTGTRTVTITTGGGTTASTASPANTFTVTQTPGTTYTPLLSSQVGVAFETTPSSVSTPVGPVVSPAVGIDLVSAPPPETPLTLNPLLSRAVGVALGPAITGIEPWAGAPGTGSMNLRVKGANLQDVTDVNLSPSTGITSGGMTVAGDGSYIDVTLSISSDAPLGPRTVRVNTATGRALPSISGADIFRVALPVPEIYSVIPILQTVGSTFTLTVNGINLSGATEVAFFPADGISVGNPPSVNAGGALATVEVSLSMDAIPGSRVVTITTPTGTSSATATSSNTFIIIGIITSQISPAIDSSRTVERDRFSIVSSEVPFPSPVTLPAGSAERQGLIFYVRDRIDNAEFERREMPAFAESGRFYSAGMDTVKIFATKEEANRTERLTGLIGSGRARAPT